MRPEWGRSVSRFLDGMWVPGTGAARSVPGGPPTLYGTCYALLCRHYLGEGGVLDESVRKFIAACQDPDTGLMVGPELRGFEAPDGALHTREHLLLHLTCAALPTCQQFGVPVAHPIRAAHRFCDARFLRRWLGERDLRHAWFEGNNILFAGQLLVYLRDQERYPGAAEALEEWFGWLDENVDPATNLWGSDGLCSPLEAVCGGYHQLLVYYHERRPLINPRGLVDTVLGLHHRDGGFNPNGNGGACEDVDAVDILVNCYRRIDYRRADVRVALARCLRHILATQNPDGGFPYSRGMPQSHMGVPGTEAAADVSTMFPTWFRVHTLALIAEVLPDHNALRGIRFRFTNNISMGWHRPWDGAMVCRTASDRLREAAVAASWGSRASVEWCAGWVRRAHTLVRHPEKLLHRFRMFLR